MITHHEALYYTVFAASYCLFSFRSKYLSQLLLYVLPLVGEINFSIRTIKQAKLLL